MKQIDKSPFLIKVITQLSSFLSRQRGLPIVFGLGLLIVGALLEFINILVGNPILAMVEVALRSFGLITALIGILLLEPLGT